MDNEPDYSNYSLADLIDAEQHIERGTHPERFMRLREAIEHRRAGLTSDPPDKTRDSLENRSFVPIIVGFLVVFGVLALVIGLTVVPKLLQTKRELEPVTTAVTTAYEEHHALEKGETHALKVLVFGSDEKRTVAIVFTDSPWGDEKKTRRKNATALATAAVEAHPEPEKVEAVHVTFWRTRKGTRGNKLVRKYEFSREDLGYEEGGQSGAEIPSVGPTSP